MSHENKPQDHQWCAEDQAGNVQAAVNNNRWVDEKKDVKIPRKLSIDAGGGFIQEIEFKDVKINSGLKAEDFK